MRPWHGLLAVAAMLALMPLLLPLYLMTLLTEALILGLFAMSLDLMVGYANVGEVLMEAGRREEALAAYQKSLAISQQLADSDQGNAGWRRDLSVAAARLGSWNSVLPHHQAAGHANQGMPVSSRGTTS